MEIHHLRREYLRGGLRRGDLLDDPIAQFKLWMKQAIEFGVPDPNAMVLATVSTSGQPSQRIVLLKYVNEQGFVFFTNLDSRKATELARRPKVSLHFPWHVMERQVEIAGVAERISRVESLKYFLLRPLGAQLVAWASEQSRPVASRRFLLQRLAEARERFAQTGVPLPDFWGGIRVQPYRIEFWQGGANRLHDRFEYDKTGTVDWHIERLSP
jgi:pyridoxamine 5'-phosphate oxidase